MSRIADTFDRALTLMFRTLVPPNVMDWPLWARRTFLLTIPVSGPLWLCWLAGFTAMLVALIGVGTVVFLLSYPVMIVFACVVAAYDLASDLWAPAPDFSIPAQPEAPSGARLGGGPES